MASKSVITSVKDISKIVIQKSPPISNLKLQKLLYYIQGWNLGLRKEPMFYERIEAWVHGPVVPAAFYEYRHFGWNTLDAPKGRIALPHPMLSHIDKVLKAYGQFTATQLEALSHEESPWIDARGSLDPKATSQVEITQDAMRKFFAAKVNG